MPNILASPTLSLLALLIPPAAQAAQFSTIGSVPGSPQIGAIHDTTLYGTVAHSGAGTLFRVSTSGSNYKLLHSFNGNVDGATPNARLALDAAGNIFGTANEGGAHNFGTIWEYSASGVMTTRHAFGVGADGTYPLQGPTLGPRGTIFGTTSEGAINGSGNIFSLAPPTAYNVVYKFLSRGDGHCPFSGVAITSRGVIYGTTVGDGFGGNPTGSVWRYSKAGGLRTLYVFRNGTDGEWPHQAPAIDADGNVYGTTFIQNGSNFPGAIWEVTAAGQFHLLHEMNAGTDGYGPNSPLLEVAGTFYGTAASGGAHNLGTVFSITKSGAFRVVHAFANSGDGGQPTGNLVRNGAGRIYGGTANGPIFKIIP